jgi:hypothetical protein
MTPTDSESDETSQGLLSTAPLEAMFTGVQAQIKAYTTQREALVQKLQEIQREVQQALEQLGVGRSEPVRRRGRPAGATKGRRGRPPGSGGKATATAGASKEAKKRGRRKFTAAQREEARKRMQKYWAERRKNAK